jgi:hypothetical protein
VYDTVTADEGPFIKVMNVGERIEVNQIEGESGRSGEILGSGGFGLVPGPGVCPGVFSPNHVRADETQVTFRHDAASSL